MKIFLFLTILFINNSVANNLSAVDLNSQNIELLALNKSTEDVVKKYVLNIIKTHHSKEYYSIFKDKTKVAEMVEKHTKETLLAASKISEKTDFILKQNVQYNKYDESTSNLKIKSFLIGNSMPISSNKARDDGMPRNFLLLIPNTTMMNNFKVDQKKFNKLIEKRQNNNKKLYMEVTMNLLKYQNLDNFQTVIKEVNIYDNENKTQLLATKKEKANASELIDDWLLSDGYTNKLVGIHAFSFFGYRLQDQMRTINTFKKYCHKTEKLGEHQVVVCKKPLKENGLFLTTFIGGILAKIELVAKSPLTKAEIALIMQTMQKNMNQTKSILNQKHVHWQKYNTDFDFYSDALKGQKSELSNYEYAFGANKIFKEVDLTLIMSIMSHETKNLIEKYK
ncbi:MAG: hypothetical protein AB8B80_01375 [Marinicellaceae bacterium]